MGLKDLLGKFSQRMSKPVRGEIAAMGLGDRMSTYPTRRLSSERLGAIFREADGGAVYRQAELFEEMEEKDAHLAGILQTRKLAVSGLEHEIVPYSRAEEDQEIARFVREVIDNLDDFDSNLLDLLDATGKGCAVTEIMWGLKGSKAIVTELRWIHQKKLTFVDSLTPRIITSEHWRGVEPPPWKIIYHRYKARSGYDTRAGMLRVIAWMYLFKNYAMKDWMAFNEVFGKPLRLGRYDATASPTDREILATAIHKLGDEAVGIINKNTEIELMEASGRASGNSNPYLVMAEFCNREMSKAILGQTLTTDTAGSTGTYSTAKVHDLVRRDLLEADAEALSRTLRSQLIRPLVGFNFGWDKPLPNFNFILEEKPDLKAISEIYLNLKNMGFPLSLEHLSERFGVPLGDGGQGKVSDQ